jgi:hypothetical protein
MRNNTERLASLKHLGKEIIRTKKKIVTFIGWKSSSQVD